VKAWYRRLAVLAGVIGVGAWWHYRTPEPTVLAFGLGDTFEEVARNSSYPVVERSNRPADDPGENKFGATWVTEPAVIIRFTDPRHGFTLPPTKFAALTYSENKVVSLATSPMLDDLPFDQAVVVLENLQNQFKVGGWGPWEGDGSTWFDLTAKGKKRLYERMFEPGYSQSAELRVPKKYAMTFRLKCVEGCWTREPPYRFLVDVGVGDDEHEWWDKEDPKNRPLIRPPMP
jgi:hypothetical protein